MVLIMSSENHSLKRIGLINNNGTLDELKASLAAFPASDKTKQETELCDANLEIMGAINTRIATHRSHEIHDQDAKKTLDLIKRQSGVQISNPELSDDRAKLLTGLHLKMLPQEKHQTEVTEISTEIQVLLANKLELSIVISPPTPIASDSPSTKSGGFAARFFGRTATASTARYSDYSFSNDSLSTTTEGRDSSRPTKFVERVSGRTSRASPETQDPSLSHDDTGSPKAQNIAKKIGNAVAKGFRSFVSSKSPDTTEKKNHVV